MPAEPLMGEAVVAQARAWLGTPWRHQGRSPRGVDCAGLVVLVARALGLADHDVAGYSRLVGADEEGTLARLKQHRRELVDPTIGEHGGRIALVEGEVTGADLVDLVGHPQPVEGERGIETGDDHEP